MRAAMKVTTVDLRRKTKEIVRALDRGESVTITYRGEEKGTIVPAGRKKRPSITESPFFGMWKDREDMKDVHEYLRRLRERRRHVV
jgi:prevent-host-death family protein